MTDPIPMDPPVRLDDLIDAIKKVHDDELDQLTDAIIAADHLGEHRRPPHRPLRRPGPALGRLVDRHRPQHGRHQAGRPEAVRAQGPRRGRRSAVRRRASTGSPPGPATRWSRAQNEARDGRQRRDRRPAPRARAAAEPEAVAAQAIVAQGVSLDTVRRIVTAALPPAAATVPPAHPLRHGREEGPRAHVPRGAAARPQLHRHRAHPARPAGAGGRSGHPHRARPRPRRGPGGGGRHPHAAHHRPARRLTVSPRTPRAAAPGSGLTRRSSSP